jgi:hypothetical protein
MEKSYNQLLADLAIARPEQRPGLIAALANCAADGNKTAKVMTAPETALVAELRKEINTLCGEQNGPEIHQHRIACNVRAIARLTGKAA